MVIVKILAYVPSEFLLYVCICFNVKINVSSKTTGKINNMELATRHITAFRIPNWMHTYQTYPKSSPSQLLNTSTKQVPKSYLCKMMPPGLLQG